MAEDDKTESVQNVNLKTGNEIFSGVCDKDLGIFLQTMNDNNVALYMGKEVTGLEPYKKDNKPVMTAEVGGACMSKGAVRTYKSFNFSCDYTKEEATKELKTKASIPKSQPVGGKAILSEEEKEIFANATERVAFGSPYFYETPLPGLTDVLTQCAANFRAAGEEKRAKNFDAVAVAVNTQKTTAKTKVSSR